MRGRGAGTGWLRLSDSRFVTGRGWVLSVRDENSAQVRGRFEVSLNLRSGNARDERRGAFSSEQRAALTTSVPSLLYSRYSLSLRACNARDERRDVGPSRPSSGRRSLPLLCRVCCTRATRYRSALATRTMRDVGLRPMVLMTSMLSLPYSTVSPATGIFPS